MATITIGPFLVKNGDSGLVASNLEHTGYSLELSGDEFALKIRLYREIFEWQPSAIRLVDFYVCADEITFKLLPTPKPQWQESVIGTLVSLEAMLVSLYLKHEVKRPLTSFLKEFRDHLPINHTFYPRIENGRKLVHPVLAEAGFEAIHFFSYGRTMTVRFGWVFPQDRQNSKSMLNLHAGMLEFKPKPDRTLPKGRWIVPVKTSVAYLFTIVLRSTMENGLLSEAGVQAAVDSFKWSKVSLLTTGEAKNARIDFVRAHPELHENPAQLARALKEAELYSDTAQICAIKKQVPKLIQAAKGN